MAKILHAKVAELKRRSAPVTVSGSYVDKDGKLQMLDFKIEAADDDRTIKGYLAVWGIKDDVGTIAVRGCFSKSIQERGPGSNAKAKIIFLWMHKLDEPIGQFTELVEDDYGLRFTAVLDDVPIAERVLRQIRSGTINQFSYGFRYIWDKMEYDTDIDAVLMYECELWEGTACTFGSNTETYAIRSKEQLDTELEELQEHTEEFIRGVPRSKQLELRQLIARHITLSKAEPIQKRESLRLNLEPEKLVLEVGSYKLNLNEF